MQLVRLTGNVERQVERRAALAARRGHLPPAAYRTGGDETMNIASCIPL